MCVFGYIYLAIHWQQNWPPKWAKHFGMYSEKKKNYPIITIISFTSDTMKSIVHPHLDTVGK